MTQTTKTIIAHLTSSLKQFGLNPNDWTIKMIPSFPSTAEIRHRRDPDLSFKGQLFNGQWHQLELFTV